MEDPKNRAESEAYLRQLEREGKAEEVYGAGTQLVVPEPGFVVETCASSGAKVFINVCSSPKVDAASSTRQEGGESWSIPFSLSSIHVEKDKSDQACVMPLLPNAHCARSPAVFAAVCGSPGPLHARARRAATL